MRVLTSRLAVIRALVPLTFVLAPGGLFQGRYEGQTTDALKDPAALNEQSPPVYKIDFDTSGGHFVLEAQREWAPIGADRFYNLVKERFFDDSRFFRVLPGYIAVFGIHADPQIHRIWRRARIPDEPRQQSNKRGTVAFNMQAALDSRTTLIMINLADNAGFDKHDDVPVSPFGRIVSGMEVVDKLYSGYGETAPTGKGPDLFKIYAEGKAYLERDFPKLDYIKTATLVP
jgi:peptidyl-prolyl cis-trans isomerase A (cyclophilin A)